MYTFGAFCGLIEIKKDLIMKKLRMGFGLLCLALCTPALGMTSEDGLGLALCTELSQLKGKQSEEARHFKKLRTEFPADYDVRIMWAKKQVAEAKAENPNFNPFITYTDLRCSLR